MMQVLIVTHANMAAGIVSSVDLIMGPQEGLYSIGLAAGDSFGSFNEKVRNKLAEIVCDDGVLVFVDLYGGTPCNVTAANINREVDGKTPNIECLSGVNLPMLIEALGMRGAMSLQEIKEHCMGMIADTCKDIKAEFNLAG